MNDTKIEQTLKGFDLGNNFKDSKASLTDFRMKIEEFYKVILQKFYKVIRITLSENISQNYGLKLTLNERR